MGCPARSWVAGKTEAANARLSHEEACQNRSRTSISAPATRQSNIGIPIFGFNRGNSFPLRQGLNAIEAQEVCYAHIDELGRTTV